MKIRGKCHLRGEKGRLTLEGQVINLETLMRTPLARNNRSITDQGIMNPREGNKIGLELGQIDIQSTVESQTGRDRTDNLRNQSIQVLVVRPRDVQVATADVVDCFIVD